MRKPLEAVFEACVGVCWLPTWPVWQTIGTAQWQALSHSRSACLYSMMDFQTGVSLRRCLACGGFAH